MPTVSRFVYQQQIAQSVEKVAAAFAPDVVRIRFSFDQDWSGADAVYFRVIVSDPSIELPRLGELARRVREAIREEVQPEQFGLESYVHFRGESEQAELREESWD